MAAHEPHMHGTTSPGEHTASTRQPTQLAVLLAGAGTPPLDPEQARLAPIRLYDAFVLAPERVRLFVGDERSLFRTQAEAIDPRHDALARIIRAVAASLRQRFEMFEGGSYVGGDLVRGVAALSQARIEGALTGYDLKRSTSAGFTAELMLGSTAMDLDPLESPDAGVLRRFVALTTRGLMVEKAGPRSSGVVADLGGVTLALALLDIVANPRSALRAARTRLGKSGKLADDGTARVREVGQALREILQHAVSSATTAGAAGRDLIKELTLTPELMDHLAVALARAVYDGLAHDEEHPLVVPGAGPSDHLTMAPILAPMETDEATTGPTLGLYNRIAFVALPYARVLPPATDGANEPAAEVRRPGRAAALDEPAFARARDGLKQPATAGRALASASGTFDAQVDPADPRHRWRRATAATVPGSIARAIAEQTAPATHVLVLTGPRSAVAREVMDALPAALAAAGPWHVLTATGSHSLGFEALAAGPQSGAQLRRADVSRWMDAGAPRAIQWTLAPGERIVVNAAALDGRSPIALEALTAIARDIADKADPRAVLIIVGACSYAAAASVVGTFARHPELESGDAPIRGGGVWLVRTDAPLSGRTLAGRSPDETMLAALAETFAPNSQLADHAARAALLPPDAKYRGRMLRLAALAQPSNAFTTARRVCERAAAEPWSGGAMRRGLQAGVASLPTARAALTAGLGLELSACMRHEVGVLVAEWEGTRERPHALRLADMARGQLIELVAVAHARFAVLGNDALIAAFAGIAPEYIERAATLDALHGTALGARAGGTVYGREESRGIVPLGFALRGGAADLYALVEVVVGPHPTRPVPVPYLEAVWKANVEREATLGSVAALLAALHEFARRLGHDSPARIGTREGRATFAAMLDVSVDNRLVPEAVRIVIPLRQGATDAETQRLGVEAIARLAEASGGNMAAEWSATATLDNKGPVQIALSGPMLLRDFGSRWTRALRLLPQYFPTGTRGNARYVRAPAVNTAAEMGMASAVLLEKGINPTGAAGRAVLSRLPAAAGETIQRARELGAMMPIRSSSLEGNEWDVLERVLAVAWFLHVNFCSSLPGALVWSPADGPAMHTIIEHHLDRTAMKLWLQRKTSRPENVETRVIALIEHFEPTIVIEHLEKV